MDTRRRFEAPRWFARTTTALAAALVVLELILAGMALYIASVVPECAPPALSEVLGLLWASLAFQGLAVLGVAAAMITVARTTAEQDGSRLALRNPWRAWHGDLAAVTRAYVHRAILTLEIDHRRWRPWRVRLAATDGEAVTALRERLAPGVWLEGATLRRHQLRQIVPALVVLAVLGVAALHVVERTLDRIALQQE